MHVSNKIAIVPQRPRIRLRLRLRIRFRFRFRFADSGFGFRFRVQAVQDWQLGLVLELPPRILHGLLLGPLKSGMQNDLADLFLEPFRSERWHHALLPGLAERQLNEREPNRSPRPRPRHTEERVTSYDDMLKARKHLNDGIR